MFGGGFGGGFGGFGGRIKQTFGHQEEEQQKDDPNDIEKEKPPVSCFRIAIQN